MKNRPENIFFKKRNPVFERENNPPPPPPPPPQKPKDEDGNDCQYMKALEKKYEPRKNRKIQNSYARMEATIHVRKSLSQIAADELIELCILSPSSFDFAMLLYKFCGSQFRCVDIVQQKWEKFDKGSWISDEMCSEKIKEIISTHVCDFFKTKLTSIRAVKQNTYISDEFASVFDLKINNIEYILSRLVTITMQNQILKDASEMFFYSCIFDGVNTNE
jgi:hypothetical protein